MIQKRDLNGLNILHGRIVNKGSMGGDSDDNDGGINARRPTGRSISAFSMDGR